MKNAGITVGMCAIGLGLASIGFNLNGNQAVATPAAFDAGPEEPTIVWYDSFPVTVAAGAGGGYGGGSFRSTSVYHDGPGFILARAWSTGIVEAKFVNRMWGCDAGAPCLSSWQVIASPNEGLNAAADINFDEMVDGDDLAQVLAYWGDAPRNDYPPSDCPLGLIP